MPWESVRQFLLNTELWQKVVAGVIAGVLLLVIGALVKRGRPPALPGSEVKTAWSDSPAQGASGSGITQTLALDRSQGKVTINVEPGATANITIVDYQDGVVNSENPLVKELFVEARGYYRSGDFTRAIDRFERCLELEKNHERRGALNIQIGNCYSEQARYLKAAEFYGAGLREARQAGDAEGRASANVGIGNTYLRSPASDGPTRGQNVRAAVEHYRQALQVFLKDEYPVQYAMTQNNLGAAYGNLAAATAEERAENVKKAVACYRAALEIYKKDEYPVDYAMTQNNLGVAYSDLPAATAEERAENIKQAVGCYQAALEIRKKDEYPVQYATTQNNLGNAYRDLPAATAEERAENIKKAVDCYLAALEIYKKDEYPVQYAATQNNLGNAYSDLPAVSAEERAENVRQAVACYRAALEIYKKDEYPQDYCVTAQNIGMTLTGIDNDEACRWLQEAYSLRQYLPEQGKELEESMEEAGCAM